MTVQAWTELRNTVAEAASLGARFRISGADVVIEGLDSLPTDVAQTINTHRGLLWHYLGARALEGPALELAKTLGVDARVVETAPDARAAVRQLIRDLRRGGGHLALDTETAPLPGHGKPRPPVTLNRNGGLSAVQPPPDRKDRTALDPHRARAALVQLYAGGATCFVFRGAALNLVLGSNWLRRQQVVAHNLGFDVAFVHQHDRPAPARQAMGSMDCTMQAVGLVLGVGEYGGGGRSLARAAKALLGITLPKELVVSDWAAARLSPGQVAYAASDAIVTWRLWPILLEKMQADDTLEAYYLQCGAIPAVVAMELHGLGIDRDEHARQSAQWACELADARQAYVQDTGKPPPSRPAELCDWLRSVLTPRQLSRWPTTEKTGELSTSSKALKPLVETVPSAAPVLVILAKKKLIESFGASLIEKINPVTGRVHCRYNIAAAKSGRFSSNDPNLQQLPSKAAPGFRKCVAAAPGMTLVAGDYNQVEVRAAAWISNDPVLTRLYEDGGDLHTENAAMIANIPVADVQKEHRSKAKAVTFGALYGISAKGLVSYAFDGFGVIMTITEAGLALNSFYSRFPTLYAWLQDNHRLCYAHGCVRIGAGRLVRSTWEKYPLRYQHHCNLPIQGICADLMLRGLRLTHDRLAGVRGGIVATVHDEILLEVEQVELASQILEQAMLDAFVETFPGAPTRDVTKIKTGKTWDMEG